MRGYFLDVQGTLIDDKDFKPLNGALEFVKYLKENKIPFIFLTNNTKRPSDEFKEYLKDLGFEFENYLDPLMVLDDIVNFPVAAYGHEKFLNIIEKKYGLDYSNPEKIVLGIKLYSNEEFADIIEMLLKGAQLVGMHKTSLYHKNGKRYPGLGAILEMLKYATGRDYEVVGKPSFRFFKKASDILKLSFDKITIISDDLYGDVLPAMELGIEGVLVLSGKIKDEKEISQKPHKIFKNIGEYLEFIRTEKTN
ncbi:MAG: HAD-IIA family hydrolase [Nautiliaceae bacterium]